MFKINTLAGVSILADQNTTSEQFGNVIQKESRSKHTPFNVSKNNSESTKNTSTFSKHAPHEQSTVHIESGSSTGYNGMAPFYPFSCQINVHQIENL